MFAFGLDWRRRSLIWSACTEGNHCSGVVVSLERATCRRIAQESMFSSPKAMHILIENNVKCNDSCTLPYYTIYTTTRIYLTRQYRRLGEHHCMYIITYFSCSLFLGWCNEVASSIRLCSRNRQDLSTLG